MFNIGDRVRIVGNVDHDYLDDYSGLTGVVDYVFTEPDTTYGQGYVINLDSGDVLDFYEVEIALEEAQ